MQDGLRIAVQQSWHPALGRKAGRDCAIDFGTRKIAELATIEFNVKDLERALRLPEMVRDDADRFGTRQLFDLRVLRAGVLVGERDRRYLHDRAHAWHARDLGPRYGSPPRIR